MDAQNQMKPEEINRAILRELGYKFVLEDLPWHFKAFSPDGKFIGVLSVEAGSDNPREPDLGSNPNIEFPNFFSDLNACRQMRQSFDQAEQLRYCVILQKVILQRKEPGEGVRQWDSVDATAHEHTETFLRVKGKWIE